MGNLLSMRISVIHGQSEAGGDAHISRLTPDNQDHFVDENIFCIKCSLSIKLTLFVGISWQSKIFRYT